MHCYACVLLFIAIVPTYALLVLDPRPAPTAPNNTIDSNESNPKPTTPPSFPRLPRQDAEVSVCGSLEGDAQGSTKVCSPGSLCIPFNSIVTNSWIFACCAYSDEAICETTAVSCLGWSDNDLSYGQSTSQISNGTLLCGDNESLCFDAALALTYGVDTITATSYYCGTITTTTSTSTSTSTITTTENAPSMAPQVTEKSVILTTFVVTQTAADTAPLLGSTVVATSTYNGEPSTVLTLNSLSSAFDSTPPISTASAPSSMPTVATAVPGSERTQSDHASSTPAIAGGALGGAAAIAVVAAFWIMSRKRKIRREAIWNPGGGRLVRDSGRYDRPPSELM